MSETNNRSGSKVMNLEKRRLIKEESIKRVKAIEFGSPITNICAGERNPQRLSWFVRLKVKSYKNRFGVIHNSYFAECTDRKGKIWLTDVEVIYPGHLSVKESDELFAPVWEADYS